MNRDQYPSRPVTTDDGVRLAVSAHGDGPALLLVHGFGGGKEDFYDHIDALATNHTVVTFDHRGHGESDKPDALEAYSFERLVADTLAVADAVGAERFRLLGHSMGGMVARKLVHSVPERVDALVLMDTSHGPIRGFDPEIIEFGAQVGLQEGKASLKNLLDSLDPLSTPAYQRLLDERPGFREFCDRKWDELSLTMWVAMVREIAHQTDDLERLRAVRVPTLVIVGDQDEPFLEASHAMAAAIPGAALAVIADAGHSPQFENPDAWRDALVGFLASVDLAQPAA